jgi:hypothetical protein
MANTINWGIIYSYSWWGNATNPIYWGSVYDIEYLTSDLRRRTSTYENNIMTTQLLENLKNC